MLKNGEGGTKSDKEKGGGGGTKSTINWPDLKTAHFAKLYIVKSDDYPYHYVNSYICGNKLNFRKTIPDC